MTPQLVRPLFSLAAAGPGQHVVTVTVTPEALGTVTVRAHVGAHGMHVEMFAANDAGREAVRAILPDLRRDLGGQGLQASVDLSSQNQPSDARDGRESGQAAADTAPQRQGADPGADPGADRDADRATALARSARSGGPLDGTDLPAAADAPGARRASSSLTTSLDVLA